MTTANAKSNDGFLAHPYVWTERLSVGVQEIDTDHRVLIELISQIDDSADMPEAFIVIGTVLAALSDYTEYHFSRENRMLDAIDYPLATEHKAKHELMKQQMQHYLGLYTENHEGLDTQELFHFLQRWLFEHILRDDLLYAPYCLNNPKASAAVSSIGLEFFMEPETGVF